MFFPIRFLNNLFFAFAFCGSMVFFDTNFYYSIIFWGGLSIVMAALAALFESLFYRYKFDSEKIENISVILSWASPDSLNKQKEERSDEFIIYDISMSDINVVNYYMYSSRVGTLFFRKKDLYAKTTEIDSVQALDFFDVHTVFFGSRSGPNVVYCIEDINEVIRKIKLARNEYIKIRDAKIRND